MKTKRCSKCKIEKYLEHFYKDKYAKDKLCHSCKECHNEYSNRLDIKEEKKRQRQTLEYKQRRKKYNQIPEVKEKNKKRNKIYSDKPEIKEKRKKKQQTQEYKDIQKKYRETKDYKLKNLLRNAKIRAKDKNIDFYLGENNGLDWLLNQWIVQNGCCLLTRIQFEYKIPNGYQTNPFGPSLDRIDNSKGYTKDNVRLVIYAMNASLNEWGEETFKKIAKAYLNKNP